MEFQNEQKPEVTTTPQIAPVSTPEPVTQAPQTAPTPAVNQTAPADPAAPIAPPAYAPNYKFKSLGEEKEFDEFIRGAIKDSETEKKVRELYERSHGLDFTKKQRDHFRTELQSTKSKWAPVETEMKQAAFYLQQNDLFKFAEMFGISEQKLVESVEQRLKYYQMSPEQRAVYDQRRQAMDQNFQLQNENVSVQDNLLNQQAEMVEMGLQMMMTSPEMQSMGSQYDQRAGKPGSFQEAVLKMGDYMTRTSGKFVPVHEAAREVIKMAALQAQSSQAAAPNPVPPAPQVVSPPQKPTITSIQAKPVSPVKAKVRNLDDLRKLQKEMAAAR